MAHPKVDPALLEREYVTSHISIRELAKQHDLSWSAVAARARKADSAGLTWEDKRAAFQRSVANTSYDKTSRRLAAEEADITSELINVNRATLAVYVQQLRDGKIAVTPKDAVAATHALMTLTGQATNRTEVIDGTSSGKFASDELRRVIEIARARIIDGTVAEPAGREPGPTRTN